MGVRHGTCSIRIGSQGDQLERYCSDSSENWREFEEKELKKGVKKTQFRGGRWNQLVLETVWREREEGKKKKKVKNRSWLRWLVLFRWENPKICCSLFR